MSPVTPPAPRRGPHARARAALPRTALLGALLIPLALACAGPPQPEETGRLFFWEIRGPQGGHAHLLGTVHALPEALAFDPAIERALAESDLLVSELDPADLDPVLLGQLMLQMGLLEGGRTLPDLLSEESWALLEERLAESPVPASQLRYMEPWVVILMIMGEGIAASGFDPEQGVEQQVLRGAPDLPVVGLETPADQFRIFADLPLDRQARLLESMLEAPAADTTLGLERLLEAWRMGDLEALRALGMPRDRLGEDADALYEALYFERNRQMAEQLAELLRKEEGELFVMIGALHTVGEEGVPALLAERGFAVRRLAKSGAGEE